MRLFLDDNTGREFQLPAGFYMELSRTNPFLTDEGSQSVPITLPPTDHNLRLVGALHRGTWTHRPVRRLLVRAQHGAVDMRGSLAIDSAHRKDGIGCTFYTSEGQLYETIGEKLLGDLAWYEFTVPGGIQGQIYYFKRIMKGEIDFDFFIFPVLTSNEFGQTDTSLSDKFILNETVSKDENPDNVTFVGETERKWITGEGDSRTEIDLPVGYGITPFLKVSYVLRYIFSQFGYTLMESMFDTETSLKRLVVVNNTADAICDNGIIRYSQLIPSQLGIMKFINMIRRKFGVEFVENGQNIFVRQWNNAIDFNPDRDFSQYADHDINIEFVDPKVLEIQMNRSLSPYANVEASGKDDLIKKYGPLRIDILGLVYEKGYTYFDPSLGNYYMAERSFISTWGGNLTWISSPFWDKTNNTELETESIEFEDVSLPLTTTGGTVKNGAVSGRVQFRLPYVGGIRNLNSAVSMDDNTVEYKEEEYEMQLMMCFSVPGWQTGVIYGGYFIFPMGTSFAYSVFGATMWGAISLTATEENNLYDLFYRRRDDMLQHANQIVKFEARLLPEEIVSLDLSVPKIVNGIKILIERIDYVLGQPDICQVTARTLHEFEN